MTKAPTATSTPTTAERRWSRLSLAVVVTRASVPAAGTSSWSPAGPLPAQRPNRKRATAHGLHEHRSERRREHERIDDRRSEPDQEDRCCQGDERRPAAASVEEPRRRDEEHDRVVVPQDRREELGGDDGDHQGGLGRQREGGNEDEEEDEQRRDDLEQCRDVAWRAKLPGDGTGSCVLRRADRVRHA